MPSVQQQKAVRIRTAQMRKAYAARKARFLELKPERWYLMDMANELGCGDDQVRKLERETGHTCKRILHKQRKRQPEKQSERCPWLARRFLSDDQLAEVDAIAARQNAEHVGR